MAWYGINYILITPNYSASFPMLFVDDSDMTIDTDSVYVANANVSGLISKIKEDATLAGIVSALGSLSIPIRTTPTTWSNQATDLIGSLIPNSAFDTAQTSTYDIGTGVAVPNVTIRNNTYGYQYASYNQNNNYPYPRIYVYSNSNDAVTFSIPVYSASILGSNGKIDPSLIVAGGFKGGILEINLNGAAHIYSIRTGNVSNITNTTAIENLRQFATYYDPIVIPPSDPYTGAGYGPSTAGGGLSSGTFNFTDNGLTDVNTPSIDLLGSGFLTAWNVNKAQLNALANWLWVTTPSQIFQQIYGNPINAVIGLNVVPVAPSIDGGSNTIKFGPEDSQVTAPKITSQYVSVDCGTLTIAPTYGSYMDYGPHSSAELFLPYCGGVPLDINDVVGKTISVKYQVDILSGACVAYIFIDGHLHYQKSGCCAGTAPVTGSQMPNVISGVLSIVGSVAGAIGSLGASGASTAAKVASGIATGTNVADAATNALKRSISYSGTVSGWAGLLGAQKPYLILTLPNAAIPAGQQQLSGYPAWVGGQLSDFSGHTECANVHLTGLRATDEEMTEIRSLLESGVIL